MSAFIKTGVIGHPIHHSKSPLIHNHWIQQYGLSGSYEAIDIPPQDLKTALPELLKEKGYSGFNLTIPHKEIALDICDDIDDIGQKIGAVNTIKLLDDGRIFGTNTDAYGFMTNLSAHHDGLSYQGKNALILGAGGAAKAILWGLLDAGIGAIYLTNRTREKADMLSKLDPRIHVIDWDQRDQKNEIIDIVVNTTALGMDGQAALNFDVSALPSHALVSDIVYAPLMTGLLQAAHNRDLPIVTGIGMLLHQARPAFQHWYGILPDVTPELEGMVL